MQTIFYLCASFLHFIQFKAQKLSSGNSEPRTGQDPALCGQFHVAVTASASISSVLSSAYKTNVLEADSSWRYKDIARKLYAEVSRKVAKRLFTEMTHLTGIFHTFDRIGKDNSLVHVDKSNIFEFVQFLGRFAHSNILQIFRTCNTPRQIRACPDNIFQTEAATSKTNSVKW